MAVREIMNPNDSRYNVKAVENSIIDWYRRHARGKEPKKQNDCGRGIQGHSASLGVNVVSTVLLKQRGQTQRSTPYRLERPFAGSRRMGAG